MDRNQLFESLAKEEHTVLLQLLGRAYKEMKIDQRRSVFGKYFSTLPPKPVEGEELLSVIEDFQQSSLAGEYYAPFAINSKNWSYIPEDTKAWFEKLGDYLRASQQLTEQGEHLYAVACFDMLYALVAAMEDGEEIVFAEEIGSWMIPGDEKAYIKAYLTSAAAMSSPQEFTDIAIPLIRRDSWQSLAKRVYRTAIHIANPEQRAHLEAEVRRQEIRVERWW